MSGVYRQARDGIIEGAIAWVIDDAEALLVAAGRYTPNYDSDADESAIGPDFVRARAPITGKAIVQGAAVCDAIVFPKLYCPACGGLAVVVGGKLLAYFDGEPFPFTPLGGDVILNFGPGGVMRLAVR